MAHVCSVIVNFCLLFSILINITIAKEIPNNDQRYHSYSVDGDVLRSLNDHFVNFRERRDVDTQIAPVVNSSSAPTLSPTGPSQKLSPKDLNQQLVGANGTGQRKDYSVPRPTLLSDAKPIQLGITEHATQPAGDGLAATMPTKLGKTLEKTVPVVTSSPGASSGTSVVADDSNEDDFLSKIDTPLESINKSIEEHYKGFHYEYKEDYFQYYNSTRFVDDTRTKQLWDSFQNFTVSALLSKSHRRAITVLLSFDFPFYGHPIRNVTVASGGFLYTGEYVHSWLAATQYIAPLMANFDTSISNDSVVRYKDNGTAFTVVWERVPLQDRPKDGLFTFSVTLYNTGDITFAYHSLPINIDNIVDDHHPVKIGLSDAYIIDKTIFFARRKTIYEYHRVNFDSQTIKNNTVINLTALTTCIQFTDCQNCITNTSHTFTCTWCPTLNRCSTGTDRKRQDWIQKGCDRSQIAVPEQCPALGTKGNNYDSQQIVPTTNQDDRWLHDVNSKPHNEHSDSKEPDVTIKSAQPLANAITPQAGGFNFAAGLLLPCMVVLCLVLWVFYAYRNPHTKSGQLLIQYRPSTWSWRRGEARYTAATIHM